MHALAWPLRSHAVRPCKVSHGGFKAGFYRQLSFGFCPGSFTAIEMERKLLLYREARVREYWIVDPKDKHISIYTFKGGEYTLQIYSIQDSAKPGVISGLEIPLSTIFAE